MKTLIKKIAILTLSSVIPLSVQSKDTAVKGYEIYEGEYISTLLLGDIHHDYIGEHADHILAYFQNTDNSDDGYFFFRLLIHDSGKVDAFFTFTGNQNIQEDLIDWEASKLKKPTDNYPHYFIYSDNIPIYFKRPLKVTGIGTDTKKYLATTSPALSFAGGYDGFIPSFSYTSISGNKSITSVSSLPVGKLWQSGNVAGLGIEKNGFIIQDYYVNASVLESEHKYIVQLLAYAKSKDGQKETDITIKPRLVYVNLDSNIQESETYNFPQPVPTLAVTRGYYDIIRSTGAYGITESVMTYAQGYKDGQGNPTFKSFIVSAFEACSAFFSLPVLGKNITVGTLIGSFIGLGALFLIIRLFR